MALWEVWGIWAEFVLHLSSGSSQSLLAKLSGYPELLLLYVRLIVTSKHRLLT